MKQVGVLLLMSVLLCFLSFVQGLRCYMCENCVRDSPKLMECGDFFQFDPDSEEKPVCMKAALESGYGYAKTCGRMAKDADMGCAEPKENSYSWVKCSCDEDKCNGGPPSTLVVLRGGGALTMFIITVIFNLIT